MNGLENKYKDQLAFVKINASTAEGLEIFSSYALFGHPAYLILNEEGEILWQLVGEQPESLLEDAILAVLND